MIFFVHKILLIFYMLKVKMMTEFLQHGQTLLVKPMFTKSFIPIH